MHSLPLLTNIAVALCAAFVGGLLARRVGLPALVGYMLAGIAIGPFTPGFVGDSDAISELAELGVIFLMFGVGIHFSLGELWAARRSAIPGALGRMALAAGFGYALASLWGWPVGASVMLGLAISVASTVVLLRGLMDNGLLATPPGQSAVGWLVVEDLATVLILVLLPPLAPSAGGFDVIGIGITLLKAAAFVGLMLFVGTRAIPWLLLRIAHTQSRELFIIAVLAIALGTALGAAKLFGVSLALGAFLAGVVINESPTSHQVSADLVPFRDAFALLFFVSIGMLVNPLALLASWSQVLALVAAIIIGKALITLVMGALFPQSARATLVIAAGSSQIGEFSFILGQAGLTLGLLNQEGYGLILAGALLSITLNPLLYALIDPAEGLLQSVPAFWRRLNPLDPGVELPAKESDGHVVIIGYGRVGHHIVDVLGELNVPRLVIEFDAARADELIRLGVPVLYGDAANSEVLDHAALERARALVVTLPDEAAAVIVVGAARRRAPTLPIIARAATADGVMRLAELGAQDIVQPELEGGLEVVRHTLLRLRYSLSEVQRYADIVRNEHYFVGEDLEAEHRTLHALTMQHDISVSWLKLDASSSLVGHTLADAGLRARTGASVIAILRGGALIANPKSAMLFEPGDLVGLIGDEEQVRKAEVVATAF
jgi:CPA2 family monovalent cation:H+ antiporter-2